MIMPKVVVMSAAGNIATGVFPRWMRTRCTAIDGFELLCRRIYRSCGLRHELSRIVKKPEGCGRRIWASRCPGSGRARDSCHTTAFACSLRPRMRYSRHDYEYTIRKAHTIQSVPYDSQSLLERELPKATSIFPYWRVTPNGSRTDTIPVSISDDIIFSWLARECSPYSSSGEPQ